MKNLEDILWNNGLMTNDNEGGDDYTDPEVDPKGTVLNMYCLAICCVSVSGSVGAPASTFGCK